MLWCPGDIQTERGVNGDLAEYIKTYTIISTRELLDTLILLPRNSPAKEQKTGKSRDYGSLSDAGDDHAICYLTTHPLYKAVCTTTIL